MSLTSPASVQSGAGTGLTSDDPNLTSDYADDCSSTTTLDNPTRGGSESDLLEAAACFSHEDVVEDIEDGTSSVLSSSLSNCSNECLAFRAPWATPPTATAEGGNKQLTRPQPSYYLTSPPLSAQSPVSSEFVVTDLGDSFPADQITSGEETTSNYSYMDHLLRDGGDLDSMDRSLLDYNAQKAAVISSHAQNGNGHALEATSSSLPTAASAEHLPVTPPNTAVILSPATPTTSPVNSPGEGGGVSVLPVIKRDLVVRFTEQQNSVRCEMMQNKKAGNPARGAENHAPSTNIVYKEQYEAQHYSKHPHGPMSPCDSESSVCNRSKENLLDQGDNPDDDQLLATPGEGGASTNLFLYNDDIAERPRMAAAISSLANYSSAIPAAPADPDAKPVEKANLGTLLGVFLPCIQNIFGVILFIRMTWVVGTAGAIQGFFVVFLGCTVTMTTAISMAAIATNGVVPGGGSYFMISRALGPEFGGAVGILFYLGTTVAAAMYIIGAVEILMTYLIGPPMSLFGPEINEASVKFNNFRVYGTFMLILLGTIVFFGVNFVNKFAALALACVLLTIFSIYVGIFVNFNGNHKADFCAVGTRIVKQVTNCSKDYGTDLFYMFCYPNETMHGKGPFNITEMANIPQNEFICDQYFEENSAAMRQGIRGLGSDVFQEAISGKFHDRGDAISNSTIESEYNLGGLPSFGYITTDIYTSFVLLVGIFFPSCTGIMAGSNRSGDLADPQKSIPVGTIAAIAVTSTVYLSSVLLFAGTVDPMLLRDKFGEGIGGSLVVGNIAWPHPKVVEIGALLSTIGAGLQSLTGAPRLLQAIAKDQIIPFLKPVESLTKKGEPLKALFVTLCICEVAVLIGNVDEIAPLLSMFFLMCYGFVNLACALQTLLKTPNWRPRFKYYHWSLSLFGVGICLAVMFMSSWYYALLAIGIAGIIYKYIEYRGAEKEWGDGLRGLALSAARFSLLRLEEGPPHTKNWRPQILVLAKMDSKLNVKHKRLFSLASQLKAGKGLTIAFSCLEGEFSSMFAEAQAAKSSIRQALRDESVKGFADVIVSTNVSVGICHVIQGAGLGGMKPNTVILGWPNNWRKREEDSWRVFVDTIRNVSSAKMALLVPKGVQRYPDSGDKVKGNIDIWWIVHDGGLLMLLPFLLKQHRTWKNCKLRIFSVAQPEDNSIQMRKDLITFLYHLRIEADVEVVELDDSDISEYTYERTLLMEQRNEMLKEMKVSDKRKGKMPRHLSSQKHEFKLVDDIIIQTDKNASDIEVENIVNRKVEKVLEHSRAEAAAHAAANDTDSTQSMEAPAKSPSKEKLGGSLQIPQQKTRESSNVRRMHTAVRLNEVIVAKSHEAKLVILNLPSPPKTIGPDRDASYMEFLEVLSEGLERCLMVRGGGREVITIYS